MPSKLCTWSHGPQANWAARVTVARATIAPRAQLLSPELKTEREPNQLK